MVCGPSCIRLGSCLGVWEHLCIYIFGGFSMICMQMRRNKCRQVPGADSILTWSTWTHRSSWVPTQPGLAMSGLQMPTLRRTVVTVHICCRFHLVH